MFLSEVIIQTPMSVFLEYILPILIVLVVAVVFAFLLGFLGTKLSVKGDPRADEVRKHLAGANCGACGYAGCDAFAKALVEGKAKLTDCNPTPRDNKAKISLIIGVEEDLGDDTVAVVHCAGGNRCKDKYVYRGYGDCQSCVMLAGGSKQCREGCMGLGTCVTSCEYDAIHLDKDLGVSVVDSKKCTSCGKCIEHCPVHIIDRMPVSKKYYCACSNHGKGKEVMSVCEVGCIACGICAKVCPEGAITMVDNLPVYDYSKCTSCGLCKDKCPRHTIRHVD